MKTARVQIRVCADVLKAFDDIVGERNRSRVLHDFMESEIIKSGMYTKYETKDGNDTIYIKNYRDY